LQQNYPLLIENAYAYDGSQPWYLLGINISGKAFIGEIRSFFENFNFPLVYGDPRTAMDKAKPLVLMEKKVLPVFC
jgi:putative ABC transport system permease protein